ncbi:NADP-specific glutamate dehydrogenase [Olavius algarvensis spirochete endosymbiont]|uniref:NADP-specific glutamate dehydrogenase n=1 Tax=Olavius algarvensis spirochete endosymbiont TaxID=260710 RepID=UPI00068A6F84|nr:NADP-specific glutamate dehydrogenase [Olavius algarvensis spirochete endosymbiont]CAD7838348.1 MAG: NADP-specific glutamate dehydrogenase (EC 1.4.1.4) [Olavius algarvensis spirochete endosymbiont]VDB00020.1 NADP-specific glutamate dehydrogenase [Olavius algarvensis spirochete endosymbiont]
MRGYVKELYDKLSGKYSWEREFLQAVSEVLGSLNPLMEREPRYRKHRVLERLVEPERTIIFRIPWIDDHGGIQVNSGYRVEFNNALGPYKGGMRFHPSVNLSILKFLGFEQIFKNSLTGLSLGGAKGGSDFDPKGKSDNEVMRFCGVLMDELYRHIGPNTDVPAGDIGVGGREIGYLFGRYKKLKNTFEGTLTGKGLGWGGSLIRPEATGYGTVYFASAMLSAHKNSIEGKRVLISGSGNVAQFVAEKILDLGGKPVSFSDSNGSIIDTDGITRAKLSWVMELKNQLRGRISEYSKEFGAKYYEGKRPWGLTEAEIAIPCATQNEIGRDETRALIDNGCICVVEGANMPTEPTAVEMLHDAKVLFGPGKAANAGGVAVSSLEMSQNSMRLSWTREEVDRRLQIIMKDIHTSCLSAARDMGVGDDYVTGANIAGFRKVADAMIDQGVV